MLQHMEHLETLQVTTSVVLKKLDALKTEKSPGADNLYPGVLKQLKNTITSPLTRIYNTSLSTSEVPRDWRVANITPIFKKGHRQKAENYRPVSLTSVCCKMLGSIIRDQIVVHLEDKNLIRYSQHGFRRGRSCDDQPVSLPGGNNAANGRGLSDGCAVPGF